MEVESGRGHLGLAQHNVNLPAVVRLVIEQMAKRNLRRLDLVLALIVRILERAIPKIDIVFREE